MKESPRSNPAASSIPRRNRETELQSDGETELQSDRATEAQSYRRYRATDATDATDDSALAACVQTLQEAAQIALADGLSEISLFKFARAVKAFEVTNAVTLAHGELANAFVIWWSAANTQLPADADFDEYQLCFEDAYSRAKTPLGANALHEAIKRAETQPVPAEASTFNGPNVGRLIAVCFHLQQLSGDSAFFLSVRDAQRVLGGLGLMTASAVLKGLVSRGILRIVKKGTQAGRRATRYRYGAASHQD